MGDVVIGFLVLALVIQWLAAGNKGEHTADGVPITVWTLWQSVIMMIVGFGTLGLSLWGLIALLEWFWPALAR